MPFNPAAILQERQCAGIYDDLDAGRSGNALKACDVLLAQQPKLYLASCLKVLALCNLHRYSQAHPIADQLIHLEADQLTESVLLALCRGLQILDREVDEADVWDRASRARPAAIEVAEKACDAFVRARQWTRLQQTALRIHKSKDGTTGKAKAAGKDDDLSFWWSMQAYSLIADDATLAGQKLALPLAQRMIVKHLETHPFGPQSDEVVYLYARILQKQGSQGRPEALRLLCEDKVGKDLCERSMTLAALRLELQKEDGRWDTILSEATAALDGGNRNWAAVETAVEAAIKVTQEAKDGLATASLADKLTSMRRLATLSSLEAKLVSLGEGKGKRNRTARLAPMYLLQQAHKHGHHKHLTQSNLVELVLGYYDDFKGKGCAFEDLEPTLFYATEQERQTLLQRWDQDERTIKSSTAKFATLDALYVAMNVAKLKRSIQSTEGNDAEAEKKLAMHYAQLYVRSLPIGVGLPKTEMQPGDDLALLTVEALLYAAHLERKGSEEGAWRTTLLLALTILRAALQHTPKAYRLRFVLIRLLLQAGAVEAAAHHFHQMGVKGVQYDTLGYMINNRFAYSTLMVPPGGEEEKLWLVNLRRMRSVWNEGRTQVPIMVGKAFQNGIFSRVEEMLRFGDKLTGSIERRLHTVEATRLRGMAVDFRTLDAEVHEIKSVSSSQPRPDQRDYSVLLNLLPRGAPTIFELTGADKVSEPDEDYLQAMHPIARNVLDPNASVQAQEVSLDRLDDGERALYSIERALSSNQDKQAIATEVSQQLVQLEENFKAHLASTTILPRQYLSDACAVFESYHLLHRPRRPLHDDGNAPDTLQDLFNEAQAQSLLTRIRSALESAPASHPLPNTLPGPWIDVIGRMLSIQSSSGKAGRTEDFTASPNVLMQRAAKEYNDGTATARRALCERIEKALEGTTDSQLAATEGSTDSQSEAK